MPLSRSISNGSDEYGRPRKSPGRVQPGTSGTLEGSITALADALSSLEAGAPSDKARRLDFGSLHQVSTSSGVCTAQLCLAKSGAAELQTASSGHLLFLKSVKRSDPSSSRQLISEPEELGKTPESPCASFLELLKKSLKKGSTSTLQLLASWVASLHTNVHKLAGVQSGGLNAGGMAAEAQPGSPGSASTSSGHGMACCSLVGLSVLSPGCVTACFYAPAWLH